METGSEGECYVKVEAETGQMYLQDKECQELQASTRSWKRAWDTRPAHTLMLGLPSRANKLPLSQPPRLGTLLQTSANEAREPW